MRRADTALLAAKRMTSQIRVHSPELDIATLEPIAGGRRQDDLAAALAAAVDAKDGDGYDHSRTVADLAGDIAELVGLSLDQVELVRMAGLLHDVGYLDVDDEIFAKGEQPTDAEWDELASHAERGARILARCGFGEIADVGPPPSRAHGRRGLSRRARRRRHPDRGPHPARRRRLRGDDARPQLPDAHDRRRGARRAGAAGSGTQFDPHCVAALRRTTAPRAGRLSAER